MPPCVSHIELKKKKSQKQCILIILYTIYFETTDSLIL